MSYFPYPTPPLRSGVICLRGDVMAKRAEMTPEEIEAYLASAEAMDDIETMGPGERTAEELEACEDGDGVTEQVKAK